MDKKIRLIIKHIYGDLSEEKIAEKTNEFWAFAGDYHSEAYSEAMVDYIRNSYEEVLFIDEDDFDQDYGVQDREPNNDGDTYNMSYSLIANGVKIEYETCGSYITGQDLIGEVEVSEYSEKASKKSIKKVNDKLTNLSNVISNFKLKEKSNDLDVDNLIGDIDDMISILIDMKE